MDLGFEPLFIPTGIENMGGFQARLLFVPKNAVSDVPKLPKITPDAASLVTATGAFVFITEGDKPQYIYATDKTVKYTAENQGETDGQSFAVSGEWFFPGTRVEAGAFSRRVNNTPGYLVLFTPEGDQFLVGQPGLPCTIKPSFDAGQARADRRGFKFTYAADSFAPFIKLGTPIDIDDLEAEVYGAPVVTAP